MKKIQDLFQKLKTDTYLLCLTILLTLTLFFNLLAFSRKFCNLYTDSVYGFFSDILGMLTDMVSISLGEWLMYIFALALLLFLLFFIFLLPFRYLKPFKHFQFPDRVRKPFIIYGKGLALFCSFLLLTYTLLWFIPFRSSLLGETGHFEKTYSTEQLRKLWKDTVAQLNNACTEVPRDENGAIIFSSKQETEKKVANAMKKLSGRYTRLKGYYPSIKPAVCSDVLHWMDIGGFTYPYTMEVTYNKYITNLYFPSLYAHESAHHQGYYQENEANFLSFLACMESDDPVLRYSAFHTIYFYINNAYVSELSKAIRKHPEAYQAWITEYKNTKLVEQIVLDEQEEKRKVEESYSSTPHPLQKYSETAQNAADVGWNTQSELLQENGYDGVVQLLLEYYYN